MKKNILIFFIAVILCRCNQNPSRIVYEGAISAPTTEHPAVETLNDSFMFSWPRDIIIMDSLLIIHDSYIQTEGFHIFNKYNGVHLKSFGKRGRGPGEFIDINSVNYNYDGRSITVFDPNIKKAIIFDITNILEVTEPGFMEFRISAAPNFIKQMILHGNKFISKGNDDKIRYGIWDPVNEDFSNIYSDYPPLAEDDEVNWSLTDYSVKTRLSPDGRKLATGTYIGGVLEIFDVEEKGFELSLARFFFEPRYDYARGAIPKWVTTTEESIIGFEDIFLTNEAVYGLIWGEERAAMENSKPYVVEFDLSGNPINKFVFDDVLESFAVDGDGIIFGVARNTEGQYFLNRYTRSKF